ncbi:glycosyltransferase [Agrococcus jejuensis]|uniref:Glycosyl transferase family 2 n=1 Tax=Agrococcus jejuensis TaxID=399736 RepID=A0A1G8FHM2_9MICO|nr:glycosyltransferase [Agrococcus jejuensis]SDH81546.1 hypothetical protein SAMN04489720_2479 [Agrococcus jejuensis]
MDLLDRLGRAVGRSARRIRTAVARRRHGDAFRYDDAPNPEVVARIDWLRRRNRTSHEPVVDAASDVTVTMTTFGRRLRTAWTSLEAIADGDVLPGRLVLALGPADASRLPASIRRLQRRGLEVLVVEREQELRVHTKWYPVAQTIAGPLVTSDDDQVYPREWLADLVRAHAAHPDDVIAHRAHRVGMDDGVLRPYTHWMPCITTEPSAQHFGTSVSGQLLPLAVVQEATAHGTRFLEVAPTADDVWLHRSALAVGASVRQVGDAPQNYPFVPDTQDGGLYQVNVMGGRNDEQIVATYDGLALQRLLAGP